MLAFFGDLRDGGMRAKIDRPTGRRIVCNTVAFTIHRFKFAPSFNFITVAHSGGRGRAAADSRFVATGEQRPASSLLDHGV
jgi:hypothetical protein